MTFDAKLLLRVDIKNKYFSFLFNNLHAISYIAYSKASKLGKACGRREFSGKEKNSEVLKRVNGSQGLLSTYEFSVIRFNRLVLQRSSSFEAFEYANLENAHHVQQATNQDSQRSSSKGEAGQKSRAAQRRTGRLDKFFYAGVSVGRGGSKVKRSWSNNRSVLSLGSGGKNGRGVSVLITVFINRMGYQL